MNYVPRLITLNAYICPFLFQNLFFFPVRIKLFTKEKEFVTNLFQICYPFFLNPCYKSRIELKCLINPKFSNIV